MPEIMSLLACVSQRVEPTTLHQLGRVIEAMLSLSGRVTMRGVSRWTRDGGSYRHRNGASQAPPPDVVGRQDWPGRFAVSPHGSPEEAFLERVNFHSAV